MEYKKNPLVGWMFEAYEYILKYKKEVGVGALVIVGLITLGVGYSFYKTGLQRQAQLDFVDGLKYFEAQVRTVDKKDEKLEADKLFFATEQEKWTKVAQIFENYYQKNMGAGIAPFFLAYQAEALLNLEKQQEAIATLEKAINLMDSSSAICSYYKVKLALMQIDSKDKNLQEVGLESLKNFASDQKSFVHEMVLYRLGEYFWYEKNFNEAKNYWNQLTLKYGKGEKKRSWWVQQAVEKLRLISCK